MIKFDDGTVQVEAVGNDTKVYLDAHVLFAVDSDGDLGIWPNGDNAEWLSSSAAVRAIRDALGAMADEMDRQENERGMDDEVASR